ncbi:fibronectin type-III domain-containing protein 3A-like isoform X2 [Colossoma macropomum]|uniref:fibronectin type-III domain-containing protein 3A-like isoform X2 n=1 Tax=Colossoma macropomum TaxID=42526 RepID=UPI0018653B15|nr:fibronectin type-III domain-containing protein 3A-like isoform X2 [Colossoma macropomum]
MMTDQHLPLLEATPMLAEVPLLPHVINGDGMQQMILVQVNPGETFTIRTEDGHFQCITGPAQVPMVSPNGTMPPIFVPPGYISQVVEENGMRKVLVLPHAVEFHPSLPPVPPHLPLYASPHPAMLHHPHVFPPELPHYVHQLPALPVYSEQDMMCHSMSVPIHEERSVKMQEQLQRRLKSGHLGTANGVPFSHSSPGPFIKGGQAAMHNGNSKGRTGLAASPTPPRLKHSGRTRASPTSSCDVKDPEEEVRRVQELLSAVCKPAVGSLTSHSAVLSWRPPLPLPSEVDTHSNTRAHTALLLSYELALSQSGTEGDFNLVYQGKDTTCTVGDLRPATHYYARVCVACSSVKGAPSETVAFTTLCSAPDAPAAPRLIQRTKSSISLQWRSPNDNGSKITGFCLEYHEQGKQSAFKEVYSGLAKQYKVMRLMPSTKYAFRLAAKNDVGMSAFSAVLSCCTASCSASPPAPPSPPRLTEAGVTWLSLEWGAPCGSASRDTLTYILEMEDKESDCGFQLKHRGEEQSCTVKELRRFTSYQFRVLVASSEGTSQPSSVVEYRTQPDQPGSPGKPSLRSPAEPHSLHVIWEAPEDDGGSPVTQYVLELSHSEWEAVYSGSLRQHVCEGLREGTWYKLRVYCQSLGGRSQVSEILSVETPPLPPGPCQALRTAGAATTSEIPLCWDPPVCDGGAPVSQYCVEMAQAAEEYQQQVFCGSDVSCTISQLLPGRTYLFWVKSRNPAGWGPLSEMCQASTAPGPPEQCSAPQLILNTSTGVLATWQTPVCNGAEVCEFRMEWGLEEGTLELLYSGPLTQYEVSDLQPATEYRCRVQAVNAVGAGLFSDVATVTTPASVPAAVEHVEEMREGALGVVMAHSPATTLALRWKEPHCHGAEISSYNIVIGEELPLSIGRTSYHILENLQPNTTYRIRVQAVNSMGAGPFSSALKLRTRALPPEPPVLECVVAGPQSLKLKWGEGLIRPQTSRGTHYCLHMQVGADRSICIYSGPCHTFKVQRLCEDTEYQFSIQAHSEAGMGPLSPSYTFSTTRSPPPQLKAPQVELIERSKYAVTWEALQPMKGDLIVYKLQMLRGREVEQLYRGPATSYTWQNPTASVACRLRVYAGRRSQDGSELWGQCSLSTGLPTTELPREHRISSCHEPQPRRSWPLTDEPFATVLLLGFVILAVLFAVLIQYFVIERE